MAKTLTHRTARRQAAFVGVFLIVVIFFVSTYRLAVVNGRSMEPTFSSGQIVLVRRRTWGTRPLRRGDVVLIQKDDEVLIKRIYRLPGESMDDPDPSVVERIMVNGAAVYYDRTEEHARRSLPHLSVPPGEVAVLGDNSLISDDSRAFGPVSIGDILGIVVDAPPALPHSYAVSMRRIR